MAVSSLITIVCFLLMNEEFTVDLEVYSYWSTTLRESILNARWKTETKKNPAVGKDIPFRNQRIR